ncbi:prepilin-type N-terminal cleavage/methylation domain-containing protein [Chitinibacter sp. SCUT-21]
MTCQANRRAVKFRELQKNRQTGFTLIELTVVLIIAGMIAVYAGYAEQERLQQQRVQSYAKQLDTLAKSVQSTYLVRASSKIVAGQPVPGFANPLRPTVAEMKAAGMLPSDQVTSGIFGGNFAIELQVQPTGCTPPMCDVGGIVRSSTPLLHEKGGVDEVSLGALLLTGPDYAVSTTANPARFTSAQSAWTLPNALGTAGLVAVRVGYNSSGWGAFVRTDGTTAINGNQVINGNTTLNGNTTITGAATTNNLNVSGTTTLLGAMNAQDISFRHATGTGNTTIQGQTTTNVLRANGATTLNAGLTVNGAQNNTGNLTVGGTSSFAGNATFANNATVNNRLTATTLKGDGAQVVNVQNAVRSSLANYATRATTADTAALANWANEATLVNCRGVYGATGPQNNMCDIRNRPIPTPAPVITTRTFETLGGTAQCGLSGSAGGGGGAGTAYYVTAKAECTVRYVDGVRDRMISNSRTGYYQINGRPGIPAGWFDANDQRMSNSFSCGNDIPAPAYPPECY